MSLGKHTLKIVYAGGEVETEFTITDNPDSFDAFKNMIILLGVTMIVSLGSTYKIRTRR